MHHFVVVNSGKQINQVVDSDITGINPAGDIVGFYNSQDGKQHGFVLTKGKFITLDIPSAIATEANGIDPQGDVVGRYVTPDGHTHAYFLAKVT
jgi:probable HAF family extracellular repeat protein